MKDIMKEELVQLFIIIIIDIACYEWLASLKGAVPVVESRNKAIYSFVAQFLSKLYTFSLKAFSSIQGRLLFLIAVVYLV